MTLTLEGYERELQRVEAERDRLREALERIREHAIERNRYIPMTGTIRACDEALGHTDFDVRHPEHPEHVCGPTCDTRPKRDA